LSSAAVIKLTLVLEQASATQPVMLPSPATLSLPAPQSEICTHFTQARVLLHLAWAQSFASLSVALNVNPTTGLRMTWETTSSPLVDHPQPHLLFASCILNTPTMERRCACWHGCWGYSLLDRSQHSECRRGAAFQDSPGSGASCPVLSPSRGRGWNQRQSPYKSGCAKRDSTTTAS